MTERFNLHYEKQGKYHTIYINDNTAIEYNKKHNKNLQTQISIVGQNDEFKGNLEHIKTINTLLNKLSEDNDRLQDRIIEMQCTIKQAYDNERTEIGKKVLKQLMEQIQ